MRAGANIYTVFMSAVDIASVAGAAPQQYLIIIIMIIMIPIIITIIMKLFLLFSCLQLQVLRGQLHRNHVASCLFPATDRLNKNKIGMFFL